MATNITIKLTSAEIREAIAGACGCGPDDVEIIITDDDSPLRAEANTTLEALNKAKGRRTRRTKSEAAE